MKNLLLLGLCLLFFQIRAQEKFRIEGLEKEVVIKIDEFGLPHIYAQTESDLFFAQGWNAARDRLFQFEIWRRQASGTVAEILGPRALKRDIGTRLFQFRGDLKKEMNHYHDHGADIITAYTNGVNAYIKWINQNKDKLPIEFKLLGIEPKEWTPAIVISRHQGLLGNINDELSIARQIAIMGEEKVLEYNYFHPKTPNIELDAKLDPEWFLKDILDLYRAYRQTLNFLPEDLIGYQIKNFDKEYWAAQINQTIDYAFPNDIDIGSNNWVISGGLSENGYPIMANDPHRRQSIPSLRYMAHLVGPGWNVIGGGEPEIPGISIGHNGYGAWGLTVFRTDAEDLYVYELNPDNPNEYWYKGDWNAFETIPDTIKVKGAEDHIVYHKYSIHGPVLYEIVDENVAFAMRCGWLEIGGSPYLASLRMDQSKSFEEFRLACNFSHIPGENMVWADKDGNIGWQAVGIAPIRNGFSGLVPLPGDGRFEWSGYLPIVLKPNILNPDKGFFATANENVTPSDYHFWNAIGFSWSDPYRGYRIDEVLSSGTNFTMTDMAKLQTDYVSVPSRELIALLSGLESKNPFVHKALTKLNQKEQIELNPHSIEAAIYVEWENTLRRNLEKKIIPEEAQPHFNFQLTKVIEILMFPGDKFDDLGIKGRDSFMIQCLEEAMENLKKRLGPDMEKWEYGQLKNKHIFLEHPLSELLSIEQSANLNIGPCLRGGNGYTVGSTGNNLNQISGASFRVIINTGDWDQSLFTNSPGQSGNPASPFFSNLFDYWSKDKFFPLYYSEDIVEKNTVEKIYLFPK